MRGDFHTPLHTMGTPILEMLTPLLNKNISGDIKELEGFDRQAGTSLKPKNNKSNVSIHVCQQLSFSQED